jgi:hypothetical protein
VEEVENVRAHTPASCSTVRRKVNSERPRIHGARSEVITVLLYFVSFASMFALFVSVIAGIFWLLTILVRKLATPSATPERRSDAAVDLNPHHLKRAGQ